MKQLLLKAALISTASATLILTILFTSSYFRLERWLPNVSYHRGGYGYLLNRAEEAQKVQNIDILFIGSSLVYRGFNPEVFQNHGIEAFNLGSNLQTPFNSYFLLKDYLPAIKPKYVVLDLYWDGMTGKIEESALDIIANAPITFNTYGMALKTRNVTVLNSLIFSQASTIVGSHNKKQKDYPNDRYVSGGFLESTLPENNSSVKELTQLPQQKINMEDSHMEYLQKIIDLCNLYEAKLIFVCTPVTKEYRNKVINYQDFIKAVSSIANAYRIPFIDYNTKKEEPYFSSVQDFYDKGHLNKRGAIKISSLFIKDLKSLNIYRELQDYKGSE